MFNFNQIAQLHLEISNNCQASCPMCSRNVHSGLENPLLKLKNWSLNDFQRIINNDVLSQVKGIYFCGNFGDPMLNNDLIDMCQYCKDESPDIKISIHTNGSARTIDWWKDLAKALPSNHRVVFAIDGLNDTHSIYRVGTHFDKIIENAQAFMSAGGIAEWCFIKFKHNEHQVEEVKKYAEEKGFQLFSMKNSSRFVGKPYFEVFDKQGIPIYNIEPPSDSNMNFISMDIIKNYKSIVENSEINCYALEMKEIYIDAHQHVYPCCYLASTPYTYIREDTVEEVRYEIRNQHTKFIEDLGGFATIDVSKKSLLDIISTPVWHSIWDKYWHTDKLIMCARICGKIKEISQPRQQVIYTETLNG